MNPKKGGLTTQKIKRLEAELDALKKDWENERARAEFWKEQFSELAEFGGQGFMPPWRKK